MLSPQEGSKPTKKIYFKQIQTNQKILHSQIGLPPQVRPQTTQVVKNSSVQQILSFLPKKNNTEQNENPQTPTTQNTPLNFDPPKSSSRHQLSLDKKGQKSVLRGRDFDHANNVEEIQSELNFSQNGQYTDRGSEQQISSSNFKLASSSHTNHNNNNLNNQNNNTGGFSTGRNRSTKSNSKDSRSEGTSGSIKSHIKINTEKLPSAFNNNFFAQPGSTKSSQPKFQKRGSLNVVESVHSPRGVIKNANSSKHFTPGLDVVGGDTKKQEELQRMGKKEYYNTNRQQFPNKVQNISQIKKIRSKDNDLEKQQQEIQNLSVNIADFEQNKNDEKTLAQQVNLIQKKLGFLTDGQQNNNNQQGQNQNKPNKILQNNFMGQQQQIVQQKQQLQQQSKIFQSQQLRGNSQENKNTKDDSQNIKKKISLKNIMASKEANSHKEKEIHNSNNLMINSKDLNSNVIKSSMQQNNNVQNNTNNQQQQNPIFLSQNSSHKKQSEDNINVNTNNYNNINSSQSIKGVNENSLKKDIRKNLNIEENYFFPRKNMNINGGDGVGGYMKNKKSNNSLQQINHSQQQLKAQKQQKKFSLNEMITLKHYSDSNIKKVLHAPSLKMYFVRELRIQDKDHSSLSKNYLENYIQQFCSDSNTNNSSLLQIQQIYYNTPEQYTSILYDYIPGINLGQLLETTMFLNEGAIKTLSIGILKGLKEIHQKSHGKTFLGLDFNNVMITPNSASQNQNQGSTSSSISLSKQENKIVIGLKNIEKQDNNLSKFRVFLETTKRYFAIKNRVRSPVVSRNTFPIETQRPAEREGVDVFELGLLLFLCLTGQDISIFNENIIKEQEQIMKEQNQQKSNQYMSPKRKSFNIQPNQHHYNPQQQQSINNINNKQMCCVLHTVLELGKMQGNKCCEHDILSVQNCKFITNMYYLNNFSDNFTNFMCKCLRFKESERPSIQSLIDDGFLNNLTFQNGGTDVSLDEMVKISNNYYDGGEQLEKLCQKLSMVLSNCETYFKDNQSDLKSLLNYAQGYFQDSLNHGKNDLVLAKLADSFQIDKKIVEKRVQSCLQEIKLKQFIDHSKQNTTNNNNNLNNSNNNNGSQNSSNSQNINRITSSSQLQSNYQLFQPSNQQNSVGQSHQQQENLPLKSNIPKMSSQQYLQQKINTQVKIRNKSDVEQMIFKNNNINNFNFNDDNNHLITNNNGNQLSKRNLSNKVRQSLNGAPFLQIFNNQQSGSQHSNQQSNSNHNIHIGKAHHTSQSQQSLKSKISQSQQGSQNHLVQQC